jgi:superfamily I DNA/RNA helicase
MIGPESIEFAADDVIVYLAAAGAGKTSAIMNEMTRLLQTYRPDELAFVTFTRKGVAHGIERALQANPQLSADDLVHFKTLHALCFRELGLTHDNILEEAEIKEFNRGFGFNLTLSEAFELQSEDDKLLSRYDTARSGSAQDAFVHNYDAVRYTKLIKDYEEYKTKKNVVDFYDCLLKFREQNKPVNVKVAFIDEAQDLTPLQWEVCQIAFSLAEKIRIAGDDYQCQPPGSLILTRRGYIPIEKLAKDDCAIVWDRSGQAFYGFKNRDYGIKRSEHALVDSYLVDVEHDGTTTSFTQNHKMLVRWGKRDTSLRCVYLMRKGRDYRIGQCQIFNKSGITHLAFRMRQEQADGLWVLFVSSNKEEILIQEQLISLRYRLPQLCFTFRKEVADSVFRSCNTYTSAETCLSDFRLDIAFPLLTDSRIRSQSGGTSIFECEACNLLPDIMLLPKLGSDHRRTLWVPFKRSRRVYTGLVYGLDVEKYHTYVTDNIVTHNSLFTYAGASPQTLIALSERYRKTKLETSYRLPKAVYRFAKGITRLIGNKVDKDFVPAKDFEGFVREVSDRNMLVRWIEKDLADNGATPYRWYLLFRNNCFIEETSALLDQYLIPYHTAQDFCIPANELAQIKRFYNYRKKGFGNEEAFERFCKEHNIKDIEEDFTESDLIASEKRYVYFSYVQKFGVEALAEMANKEPFLLLSTTHRVKGGEADFVVVFLDCTRRVAENAMLNMDEELRVLYVACTRAKTGLFLAASRGKDGLDKIVDAVKEQVA